MNFNRTKIAEKQFLFFKVTVWEKDYNGKRELQLSTKETSIDMGSGTTKAFLGFLKEYLDESIYQQEKV